MLSTLSLTNIVNYIIYSVTFRKHITIIIKNRWDNKVSKTLRSKQNINIKINKCDIFNGVKQNNRAIT